MSQTGWTPVPTPDAVTSAWTPVQEQGAAPPTTPPVPETGVLAGVKRNTVGMVQGLYHAFTDPATDQEKAELTKKVQDANAKGENIPPELATSPSRATLAYHRLIDAPADELELKGQNERAAAKDLLKNGQIVKGANEYLSGVTDKVLSYVPMLGPTFNNIAQRFENGDHSGAAVDMTALMAPNIVEGIRQFRPVATLLTPPGAPERMYESALKPSTTIEPTKRAAVVKTGLENELPVTKGGLEKLNDLVDDLNAKTRAVIANASNQGATINKYAVTGKLSDLATTFKTQVNPTADLNAISASGNEFLENQPNQIPAAEAQAMKAGTYKQLRGKYGELGSAAIESQKALARGIKEELVAQFPELKDYGMQEKELLDLQDVLERAVNRNSNHQIIGIGTPIAAGAAKAVTGSSPVGAAVGLLKAVVDDPYVKSKLAIALARKGPPKLGVAGAVNRISAWSAALGNAANAGTRGGQDNEQ